MSKEIELLHCPFCGSKAEFLTYAGEENRKHKYKVGCMADNSDHHGEDGVSEDWCPMELETDWQLTREVAAEIWNTRPDTELVRLKRNIEQVFKLHSGTINTDYKQLCLQVKVLIDKESK